MLHVHRSERAEALVAPLAEVLARPPADPFTRDVVAVPTKGVERWLAQRLSHRLGAAADGEAGVCAGVGFASPSRLVARVLAGVFDLDPGKDPWSVEALTWTVLAVVDEHLTEPWCAPLAHHLDERDGVPRAGRRLAVARRLAGLFASYAAQRPQLLVGWAGGTDVDPDGEPAADLTADLAAGGAADLTWQAELWRRTRDRVGVPSPSERLTEAVRRLRRDPGAGGALDLPERLSVFGPTRLPQAQLEVLDALGAHRDVHLWLPHPSPVLWQRVLATPRISPCRSDSPPVARHPLLASMARDAVELQQRLFAPAGGPSTVTDTHHPPEPPPFSPAGRAPSLLVALQRSLREDLVGPQDDGDGSGDAATASTHRLDPADRSIQVHACHGRARQVEVLREVIVGLLQDDPTLDPRDVLVMCPDIETFAPAVAAGFGLAAPDRTGRDGEAPGQHAVHPGQQLTVRLTDRSLRQTNPQLALLAGLLDLAASRVEAGAVLDLIASDPVRRRFAFTDDDLERIREWAVATRVSWGENAERRTGYGLPHVLQGTWQVALDRLLVGAAMAEDHEAGYLGSALPLDDVDSTDIDLAGRLAELVERLELLLGELTGTRPVSAWLATLGAALDLLARAAPGQGWQMVEARQLLADVAASAQANAGTEVRLSDVRALLAGRLAGRPTRAGFRTGALTVCSLEPMRAVPHRVICLLGLDDGTFPRSAPDAGDDLLLREPRIGERDRRSEDRQLFLDAVTAAREHLVVLYTGADERTGAARPPAVPVGELLDALDAVASTDDAVPVREHLLVRHPLQPVDVRNFVPGGLGAPVGRRPFSFDAHAYRAACTAPPVAPSAAPAARLLARPLPPRPRAEEDMQVDLDDLVAMLEHPARWFVRRRLGVWVPGEDEEAEYRIPLELDGLEQWAIGDRMLSDCLAGVPRERALAAEYRRGRLPPRELGRRALQRIEQNLAPIARAARAHQGSPGTTVDLVVDLPTGLRLAGSVPGVHDTVVVRATYSRMAAKHRVRAWVQVLALAAAHPQRSWSTATVGRGGGGRAVAALSRLAAPPAPLALARLVDLVRLRDRALREPLPMPVATAHAYARCRQAGESVEQALAEADRAWQLEREDAYLQLCWGSKAALHVLLDAPTAAEQSWSGEETSRLGAFGRRVWDPLLAAEELSTR